MPFVSFVMPAFKARFLKEAISSVLAQSYQDFEVVVVNDKSPDNLRDIVASFADERIRYYENETNIGAKDLVMNWNKCIALARGKWAVLACDDDIYDTHFLEELLGLLADYPAVHIAHCRAKVVDGSGELIAIRDAASRYESFQEFVYHNIVRMRSLSVGEFVFNLQSLRAIGGFVTMPLAWGADNATWCRLAALGGIAYSSRMLFSWRASGVNISTMQDNLVRKMEARIAFIRYFEKQIFPLFRGENPIEKFYEGVILTNYSGNIHGASYNDVVQCKSLRLLVDILRNKDLRDFFGLKMINRMFAKVLFLKMSGN